MASLEAGQGSLRRFPVSQEDKYRDKIKICPPYQLTRALAQNERRGGQFGIGAEKPGKLPKKSSYDLTLALILKSLYKKSGNRDTFLNGMMPGFEMHF